MIKEFFRIKSQIRFDRQIFSTLQFRLIESNQYRNWSHYLLMSTWVFCAFFIRFELHCFELTQTESMQMNWIYANQSNGADSTPHFTRCIEFNWKSVYQDLHSFSSFLTTILAKLYFNLTFLHSIKKRNEYKGISLYEI